MRSGIYSIAHEGGKRYVGSAVNLAKRWDQHRSLLRSFSHPNRHLQAAWNKYGEGSFVFEVLEECEIPQLIEREQWWMDCAQPEYNICKTAGSCLGRKFTDEARRRMRAAQLGSHPSDEARLHMSESHLGKKLGPQSQEHRRKIGEANRGRRRKSRTVEANRGQ